MREGVLVVIVSRASNLHNTRSVSKQNPYCTVRIQNLVHKTKVIQRGGQSPAWDFEARFTLQEDLDSRFLKVSIFDEGNKEPQIIGDVTVDLAPAYAASSKVGYDSWHKITYSGKQTGEVYLEITYYPKSRSRRPKGLSQSLSQSALSSSASVSSLSSIGSNGSRRPLPALPGASQPAASAPNISRTPSPMRRSVESRGASTDLANTSMPDLRPRRLNGSRSAASRHRDSTHSLSALREPSPDPMPMEVARPQPPREPEMDTYVSSCEEDLAIPEPPEHLDFSFNQSMHADHSFHMGSVLDFDDEPEPEPEPTKEKNVAQINQWYGKAMFQRFRKA